MIELVTVVAIVGLMLAIVAPRFRVSEAMEVQIAARQLAQDLDFARTRALATRSPVRIAFDIGGRSYAGYRDHDDDGTISQTPAERQALQGFGLRELTERIEYERGGVPEVPGVASGGAITFPDYHVDFDARGLSVPIGTSGAVYLRHKVKQDRVAAVTVTAAGNVRVWTWRDGVWQ